MNNERIEGTNLYLEGELTLVDSNGDPVQIFDEGTTRSDIEFWIKGYQAGKTGSIHHFSKRNPSLPAQYMGVEMNPGDLPSKDELLQYLADNGSTNEALGAFAEDRYEGYVSNVYWRYPIPVGECNGMVIIPVREGLLSIGYYDQSSWLDIQKGVCIYDKDQCQIIINDIQDYANGLCSAIKDSCNVFGHPLDADTES